MNVNLSEQLFKRVDRFLDICELYVTSIASEWEFEDDEEESEELKESI